ncbi:MAG: NAD(P)/FAD-dependent oxidoreductase [Lachnospiraceae bacterium]|nr:NAD(P)/FAD-dependent oxidoreductase [Lachnospiraceae bacterium]MDD7379311.1 NAD(P)/FAD-dependent oxidoreductase [Lachnospiraceae bacterium]MDY4617082.1 NAD(P)/FAD-dependent oxidoreductase [Lachnospiraceae bacterium]
MSNVIVIGGGAAGMFAALGAAEAGHRVTILEQNEKLGKKIYITGKGRCNLTNACDTEEIFAHVPRNAKFLYSAIYTYDNFRVMDFFEANGMPIKTERGNRVFPVSDHSSDVISTLQKALEKAGVEVLLHTKVTEILSKDGKITGVRLKNGEKRTADAIILATGGKSYSSTGSTGDGFVFAEQLGHKIEEPVPSLVPMTVLEDYCMQMQGLSLRNVQATIREGGKVFFEEFGEMLFTHFGVSGPLMLSASSVVNDRLRKKNLSLTIDLKPALSEEQLDARILRDFEENKNRQFKNSVKGLLPAKMIPVVISLSGIDPEKKINGITKQERKKLVECIKAFPLTLTGLRGFNEAIITRGGVSVKQVDPSTMESKLVKGLYFAGEILDVDAYTGGFNLQIAWSTGYLAGSSIAE